MTCAPVIIQTRKARTTKSRVTGATQATPQAFTAWCPTCGHTGAPLFVGATAETDAKRWAAQHKPGDAS